MIVYRIIKFFILYYAKGRSFSYSFLQIFSKISGGENLTKHTLHGDL